MDTDNYAQFSQPQVFEPQFSQPQVFEPQHDIPRVTIVDYNPSQRYRGYDPAPKHCCLKLLSCCCCCCLYIVFVLFMLTIIGIAFFLLGINLI